mmetsp:Transcript_44047/g.52880  ORF Transcript_44047/g.52880 Transcript_44047/m.52880 type:complete len:104 (+) Transcript_44047:581-892(+)
MKRSILTIIFERVLFWRLNVIAPSTNRSLSTMEEARPIMSHHEGIMTALTRANFKKFSTSHISPKDLGEDGQYIDNINEGDSELEEQVHLLTKVALKNLADIL